MAYGDFLDDGGLDATESLIETSADPGTILPTDLEVLSIRQESLENLLVDWPNALVFLKDAGVVMDF